jgi:putative ABC transport system permease protein
MRHIVTPLLRHYLMPLLVVVQVALACAITCNALFLLQQRLVPILATDGVSDPGRLIVAWQIAAKGKPWAPSRLLQTEAALRDIPGVDAVSIAGSIPMQVLVQMNGEVIAEGSDAQANAAVYVGDNLVHTLGLKLVAGRDFSLDERVVQYKDVGINDNGPTIITRALAQRMFPDGNALGKVFRIGKDADAGRRTVVGIVDHLMRNQVTEVSQQSIDYSMVFPGVPGDWPLPTFAVRAHPAAGIETLRKAVKVTIEREFGSEMVQGVEPYYETYSDLRERTLARSKASVWLLGAVSVVVLIVTLAGIMGLTAYWVQQRTRQIGVRRALGARRRDILHWLQLENALIIGVGVAIGMLLAYAFNLWLMTRYEFSRLPISYLPLGAALLLVLGQLAVIGPARRAARVPPAVATRSV